MDTQSTASALPKHRRHIPTPSAPRARYLNRVPNDPVAMVALGTLIARSSHASARADAEGVLTRALELDARSGRGHLSLGERGAQLGLVGSVLQSVLDGC